MKNSKKARIWDLINYLVCEYKAKVEIAYDEITLYHPLIDHTHVRYNDSNIIEVLSNLCLQLDFEQNEKQLGK